eukprot:8907803-Karenia_brevis.AAC.1
MVRHHIHHLCSLFRRRLRTQEKSDMFQKLVLLNTTSGFRKTAVIYAIAHVPHPPLHVALDWVGNVQHRLAIIAFLAGDFFLGRYAGNYFGKSFLPCSSSRASQLQDGSIDAA